jgi:hypothetical protein
LVQKNGQPKADPNIPKRGRGRGGEGRAEWILKKKIGVIFNIAKNNNIVFPILGSKRWGMGFPRHPSEFAPSLKHLLVKTYLVCMFWLHPFSCTLQSLFLLLIRHK